ncbi:MAG: hypothetical protein M0Q41_13025 [Bacteroidales bacterium]|nr:hypothetical protein [Acholeplasmataceae bacterium]MCK9449884.1 hypothetical protein [Bacteroidales bacterium]
MELTWTESYLIIALRILMPFFRRHRFRLSEIEFGFKNGDYLVFTENAFHNAKEIKIIYNPGFDIVVNRKNGFNLKRESLVKLKRQYQAFSHLPENYQGEEELSNILKEYTLFIEDHFL